MIGQGIQPLSLCSSSNLARRLFASSLFQFEEVFDDGFKPLLLRWDPFSTVRHAPNSSHSPNGAITPSSSSSPTLK